MERGGEVVIELEVLMGFFDAVQMGRDGWFVVRIRIFIFAVWM